jgi:signal transduction histidine kinase
MGYARDELDAKSMTIVLDVGTTTVKATIEHDGRSFDPEAVLSAESSEDASGLRTLRDRIELVGGALEVQSSEDEISRYVITLPATTNVEE